MKISDRITQRYIGEVSTKEDQSMVRHRINWICRRVAGKKVIDIGCSQGIVSILLAREGFEVVGLDIDETTMEYANSDREKEPSQVQQRLAFVLGNFYEVDLAACTFHTAIMGEFLEHQAKPADAIAKAYELLVDDGRLIITVPFGLFKDPDHKQTFYVASLYRLVHPYFVISEVEIIGRYLCLLCARREVVVKKQMDTIELALVERAEQEFQHRELALTGEAEELQAKLNIVSRETMRLRVELAKVESSFPFRLGQADSGGPQARPQYYLAAVSRV
jgi:ubiquinone/menaquinone biosynthesis C-methylase UbiE